MRDKECMCMGVSVLCRVGREPVWIQDVRLLMPMHANYSLLLHHSHHSCNPTTFPHLLSRQAEERSEEDGEREGGRGRGREGERSGQAIRGLVPLALIAWTLAGCATAMFINADDAC